MRVIKLKMFVAALLTALLLATSTVGASNKVFKTVHKDGSVTYSDQETPGSIEVVLNVPTSTFEARAIQPPPVLQRTQKEKITHTVTILSPQPEATVRSNSGEISIGASIEPKVGGFFQLHINEQIHESATGMFRLTNMERGAYKYTVKFIDNSGKLIASSESRNLYLHQASALIN